MVSEMSEVIRWSWCISLRVDVQDASSASEPVIPAPKVNRADTILPEHGGTHDTWLDSDIEIRGFEDREWIVGEDTGEGDKLSMAGAVQGPVGFVHASADDLAIPDEDATHGCFVANKGEFSLGHKVSMYVA